MHCRLVRILFLVLALIPVSAFAEQRFALVIGNSAYRNIDPLKNPANDAKLISQSLREADFEVELLLDANQRTMEEAVDKFTRQLNNAGKQAVGLFYFAGHGVNLAGVNYLIPVGSSIADATDVKYNTLAANRVLGKMENAQNNIDIMILDACRNNPFPSRGISLGNSRDAATDGLARMNARGSYVAFSTAEGAVAYDGDGLYSPFAEAFAGEIKTAGVTIDQMMTGVRRRVQEITAGMGSSVQRPYTETSLTHDFYFNPTASSGATVAGGAAIVHQAPSKSPEDLLWEKVQADNTIEDYDFYLKQHPEGKYVTNAKYERRKLRRAEKEAQDAAGGGSDADESGSNVLVDALGALVGAAAQEQDASRGMQGQYPAQDVWYDDSFVQWQVQMSGAGFSASTIYPGVGPLSMQGQFQGSIVNYGIYDANGNQIGYGQGTFDGQSHIAATSYWMNGQIIGSGQFHINHPPN